MHKASRVTCFPLNTFWAPTNSIALPYKTLRLNISAQLNLHPCALASAHLSALFNTPPPVTLLETGEIIFPQRSSERSLKGSEKAYCIQRGNSVHKVSSYAGTGCYIFKRNISIGRRNVSQIGAVWKKSFDVEEGLKGKPPGPSFNPWTLERVEWIGNGGASEWKLDRRPFTGSLVSGYHANAGNRKRRWGAQRPRRAASFPGREAAVLKIRSPGKLERLRLLLPRDRPLSVAGELLRARFIDLLPGK